MKVKAIRLQNFMGFEDTGWIELRPITLLFGRNSSGKSAIIRALLLLRQSLRTDNGEPLAFVVEDGADLGSFQKMIHGRKIYERSPKPDPDPDKDDPGQLRQMTFGFRCLISDYLLNNLGPPDSPDFLNKCVDLSLSFQWNTKLRKVELSGLSIEATFPIRTRPQDKRTILQTELTDNNGQPDWFLSSDLHDLHFPDEPNAKEEDQTWLPSFQIVRQIDKNYDQSLATRFFGIDHIYRYYERNDNEESFLPMLILAQGAEVTGASLIRDIFNECSRVIREWLENRPIRHLGPIRFGPRRTYLNSDLSRHRWDATGQSAISDFAMSDLDKAARQKLNDWLEHLELGEDLSIIPFKAVNSEEATADAFQIEVYEGGNQSNVNLRDIGYGASQVLPVVLQALFAPDDAFVVVEQPELHLHSEAQAKLADLFISQMRKGRQFLVETHSEDILLRIQLRIAGATPLRLESSDSAQVKMEEFVNQETQGLQGKDIGLVFISRNRKQGISQARYVRFDYLGRLINPPSAFGWFFDRGYLDSTALSLAKARTTLLESEDEASN